jgi:hypothetical protein
MLSTYRAALVARMDARGTKRLTPSTVARKLAAVRSLLRFCRSTGLMRLMPEIIASVLKSPTATVIRLYEMLTQAEQARVLDMLHDRPRDRVKAMAAKIRWFRKKREANTRPPLNSLCAEPFAGFDSASPAIFILRGTSSPKLSAGWNDASVDIPRNRLADKRQLHISYIDRRNFGEIHKLKYPWKKAKCWQLPMLAL